MQPAKQEGGGKALGILTCLRHRPRGSYFASWALALRVLPLSPLVLKDRRVPVAFRIYLSSVLTGGILPGGED